MGGLTKEWFLLLIRQIFSPDYGIKFDLKKKVKFSCFIGMFVFYESSGIFWFNGASTDNIREYNLVGILMGLAVYNAIILDIRFPLVCYKKLLTPAFLPEHMGNLSKIHIGIIKPTLTDFRTIRPVSHHKLIF
jgi:E3 ubiquitin-protein ligase HECTD2